ncbi:hypothetical protein ACWEQA_12860 [Nocardia sp. NPDC004085]
MYRIASTDGQTEQTAETAGAASVGLVDSVILTEILSTRVEASMDPLVDDPVVLPAVAMLTNR